MDINCIIYATAETVIPQKAWTPNSKCLSTSELSIDTSQLFAEVLITVKYVIGVEELGMRRQGLY